MFGPLDRHRVDDKILQLLVNAKLIIAERAKFEHLQVARQQQFAAGRTNQAQFAADFAVFSQLISHICLKYCFTSSFGKTGQADKGCLIVLLI